MNKRRRFFPDFILIIPVIIAAVSLVVMLLWNALLPEIINVKSINYWQAMGLLVLSKILFGGFGRRGGFGRQPNNIREKFRNMTPEEKENFRNQWKQRCMKRNNESL